MPHVIFPQLEHGCLKIGLLAVMVFLHTKCRKAYRLCNVDKPSTYLLGLR